MMQNTSFDTLIPDGVPDIPQNSYYHQAILPHSETQRLDHIGKLLRTHQ